MTLPYKFQTKALIREGKTTQAAIDEIKNWLKVTTLPQLQEEYIALFLFSCFNDVSDTKNTIEAYVRIKNSSPEIFNCCNFDQDDMKRATDVMHSCMISTRMNNNTVICLAKLHDMDYRNFDIVSFIRLCIIITSATQVYDPPDDLIAVIDPKGLSFMHLTRIRIGALKTFIEYVQEAMPLKIKNIHIFNVNYVIEKLYGILKIFMKKELIDAIKLHPPQMNMKQFHKEWIPTTYLPKDFGGDLPSMEMLNEKTVKQVRQLTPFFQAEEHLRRFNYN